MKKIIFYTGNFDGCNQDCQEEFGESLCATSESPRKEMSVIFKETYEIVVRWFEHYRPTSDYNYVFFSNNEHVLNAVRVAVKNKIIPHDIFEFRYFQYHEASKEFYCQKPAMLEGGRISNWPDGFFDQWDKELEILLDVS